MFRQLAARFKAKERAIDKAYGYDISTPEARTRAHRHFKWIDHGILRTFWTNLDEIAPGVWRSNQPDRDRIHKYKEMGIKTIINLRGTNRRSPFLFEEEACHETGLTMISHAVHARSLVSAQILLDLLGTFETAEKPFLMHCKSGADRAGLAAALYLLHCEGASIEDAKAQLSFKYVHISRSKTGVLDEMLLAYERDCREREMPIKDWLQTRYDLEKITAEFNAR